MTETDFDIAMQKAIKFLRKLPANTFAAIYTACDDGSWGGCQYNGVYYTEWEVYFASLDRDEGYEEFL